MDSLGVNRSGSVARSAHQMSLIHAAGCRPSRMRRGSGPQDETDRMTQAEPIIERAHDLARSGHLRQGARLLRDRLAEDPRNNEVRRALAQMYRDGGHLDQAGRFEFGMPYATPGEQAAFLRHVIAIGADEASLRRLCILPDDAAIPEDITTRLAGVRRAQNDSAAWDIVAMLGGIAFALVSLLTVLAVYVIVILGGDIALPVARVGGLASLAALVILTLAIAMSYWIDGSWRTAVGWSFATAILTVLCILATIAVSG